MSVIHRGANVKINDKGAKIQVSFKDQAKYIYIKPSYDQDGFPLIREQLTDQFRREGFSQLESAQKAREIFYGFFSACEAITKEGKYPFRIFIKDLDLKILQKEILEDGTGDPQSLDTP